jgi:hypothetical protein
MNREPVPPIPRIPVVPNHETRGVAAADGGRKLRARLDPRRPPPCVRSRGGTPLEVPPALRAARARGPTWVFPPRGFLREHARRLSAGCFRFAPALGFTPDPCRVLISRWGVRAPRNQGLSGSLPGGSGGETFAPVGRAALSFSPSLAGGTPDPGQKNRGYGVPRSRRDKSRETPRSQTDRGLLAGTEPGGLLHGGAAGGAGRT